MKYYTSVLAIFFVTSGCASLSYKERVVATMVGAGVVGSVIGAATSPKGENSTAHSLLWGGVAAASAGVAAMYIYEDNTLKEQKRQIDVLQKEVNVLRGEESSSDSTGRLLGIQSNRENNLPPEYQKLVKPGRTTVYEINQWVSAGENQLIHQDKMIKLEPAQIKVGASGANQ
jgi:hypothetical protein